jgi:integrase
VTRRHGQARTGEIKRTETGWAIRYRDGRGVRRQRSGFRTKAEAKQVLDDELRKARLGPLYRPEATLVELVDVFLEQYQAAPASHAWMRQHLGKATAVFGDLPIGELDALIISRWRAGLPVTMRHGAHRALRQVLAAAVRWQWLDRNVAVDVANPMHARMEFEPFESWEEVDALARELGPFGPLAIFCVGTGVRPEEAFGADWTDIDLQAGVFTVRRAFAKGRLKSYPKTERSRRRVP